MSCLSLCSEEHWHTPELVRFELCFFFFHIKETFKKWLVSNISNEKCNYLHLVWNVSINGEQSLCAMLFGARYQNRIDWERRTPGLCVSRCLFVTRIVIPSKSQGIMVYLVCSIIGGIKFIVGKSDLVNSRPFPIC